MVQEAEAQPEKSIAHSAFRFFSCHWPRPAGTQAGVNGLRLPNFNEVWQLKYIHEYVICFVFLGGGFEHGIDIVKAIGEVDLGDMHHGMKLKEVLQYVPNSQQLLVSMGFDSRLASQTEGFACFYSKAKVTRGLCLERYANCMPVGDPRCT